MGTVQEMLIEIRKHASTFGSTKNNIFCFQGQRLTLETIKKKIKQHRVSKNGFAIFSRAVVVGSKWSLMVPVTVWDVTASMWAVTASMWAVIASMWAVASSMSDIATSMHDVQVLCRPLHPLCGLLQPLCVMCRRYGGYGIIYVGCYSLYA